MLHAITRSPAPAPTLTPLPARPVATLTPAKTADSLALSVAATTMLPVTRQGRNLMLDGKPFRFVGINAYDLANLGERSESELEKTLKTIAASGTDVVRVSCYAGHSPESLQRVLDTSTRLGLGLRFIPVLGNQWKDMETGSEAKQKDAAWYKDGYKTTYLPHVQEMVKALGNRPEILMWEPINEPDVLNSAAVTRFTADAAHTIKANGGSLVGISNVGTVLVGLHPGYYHAMAAIPDVDVISLHDYAANYSQNPVVQTMLGFVGNQLIAAESLTARLANKPFYIGEVGTKITQGGKDSKTVATPAGSMAGDLAKARTAIGHGAQGVLLWGPSPDGHSTDGHGYNMRFGVGDATGSLLKQTLDQVKASFRKP